MAIASHVLAPREAYRLWAATYPSSAQNALMRAEQRAVTALMAKVKPARALDAGTGSGRYLPELAAAGATLVVGLDFSPEMLAHGPRCGLRVCADARRLPFGRGAFDLVNASLMAGDIDDLAAWIGATAEVLTPGGHFIYSDFHPTWERNGWRRTFQTPDGRTRHLPLFPHALDQHVAALASAGMVLADLLELGLLENDADESSATFRRRWGNPPVAVVVHATKPC